MAWRTLNPWGHVSQANRMARMQTERQIAAYGRILQVEGAKELFDAVKELSEKARAGGGAPALTDAERKRYNDLCDQLNAKGLDDRTIETALGE